MKKILIIGYGSSGKKYEKIIRKNYKHLNLKIFTSKNYNNSKFINKNKQIKNYNPHLAIICSPSTKRLKIYNILNKINANILFEKPLAGNLSQSNLIIDNKNKIYKVGYNLKQLEILQKFKEILDSKKFGKIIYYSIHVSQYLPNWRKINYKKTVSAKKSLGGGVLLELSHEIDYSVYLFGKIKLIKSIYKNSNFLKINTEDICKILFITKKNIIGSIHMDFVSKVSERYCEVATNKGNLRLDFIKKTIEFKTNKKKLLLFKSKEKISDTYRRQLDQMINLINKKNDKNNLTSIKSSKYVLEIIEKIKNEKYYKKEH